MGAGRPRAARGFAGVQQLRHAAGPARPPAGLPPGTAPPRLRWPLRLPSVPRLPALAPPQSPAPPAQIPTVARVGNGVANFEPPESLLNEEEEDMSNSVGSYPPSDLTGGTHRRKPPPLHLALVILRKMFFLLQKIITILEEGHKCSLNAHYPEKKTMTQKSVTKYPPAQNPAVESCVGDFEPANHPKPLHLVPMGTHVYRGTGTTMGIPSKP